MGRKLEWLVYIGSFIQNILFVMCFTYLANRFDKWWIILISVVFISVGKYNGEMTFRGETQKDTESKQ